MRVVVQRVSEASVEVNGDQVAAIGPGLLVLLGVAAEDQAEDGEYLAEKVTHLRIFPDTAGKMNLNVKEIGGSVLVVSQFTLYGNVRKGRRPSFDQAAAPEHARRLYVTFLEQMRKRELPVAAGIFQAHMSVRLINEGPVTIIIDSERN